MDLLVHRSSHQAHDRAFIFLRDGETDELTLTYAELDRQARAIGARLQAMGMTGERALLLYPAGLDFIAAFFGCLYAGVVAVPAYPPRRNRNLTRIQGICANAEAKIALTTAEVYERIQGVLDTTPLLSSIKWLATDTLPADEESNWQRPDVHGDTLAFLQYTSGSTGTPKGVVLNHANLLHNSALISYAFEHTRSGRGVFWLPSYHDMGLIGGILQPIYMGLLNILISPVSFLQKPFRWLNLISKYRASISGGPNFAYDLCVNKITPEQRDTLDLSSWGLAFNGAEPVREETIERFCHYFAPCGFKREAFYPCYGMAENTLIVSGGYRAVPPVIRYFESKALEQNQVVDAISDEEGARAMVGCGGHLLDEEIVIADPHTLARCAPDEVGEIWVSGPSVAQGYWKRPEMTEQIFRARLSDTGKGPYLRTGDLGFLRDGELFVTGRLKDLIIVHGVNHYPQDIERTVEEAHSDLKPGAGGAFTVEHSGKERLVIVSEMERGKHRQVDDFSGVFEAIRRAVSAEHEVPVEGIVLIKAGSIPKTSSGKIQRHACKRGFLDGSLEEVARWGLWEKAPTPAESAVAESASVAPTTAYSSNESLPNTNFGMAMNGQHSSTDEGAASEKAAPDKATPAKVELAKKPAPTSTAPGGSSTNDVALIVYEQVRKVAKERTPARMTIETNIVELGMDSIERMEIVAALEDIFGGRFPEAVLTTMETCGEVVAAVEQYLGKIPQQKTSKPAEIPQENYRFELYPEYIALKQNIAAIKAAGVVIPYFNQHERITADTAIIGGREMINWSNYNYLGMSGDPTVMQAAKDAIERYGTSVSASRLVSGEKPIHRELERAIAGFIGVDDAITFVGGHSTNETTIGHLFGPGDLILHDSLAHNSIVQGSLLSGARRRPFPHNDWRVLDELLNELRGEYRRCVVVIEGVYSMDGDYPDLPQFINLRKKHKVFLMVDEAHSAGTMGNHGRGIAEHFDVDPRDVDIWMGTLSKAYGSCGGYIAGSKALVEYLKYTAPGFVYSVGLSPPNAAAALASLRLLEDEPERVVKLHANSALFLRLAKEQGFNTGMSRDTAVVPMILGNSLHALRLAQALFARGINVQPIMYPAVEESAARLRFFITSKHSEEQIRQTITVLSEELSKIDPQHLKHGERGRVNRGPQISIGGKDA